MNIDKNIDMDKICTQIIQRLSANDEIAQLEESPISIIEINKIKDLQKLKDFKSVFICKASKLIKYANLYTKSKIITFGNGGKFNISHKHYLNDGILVEIERNSLPFLRVKLNIYSSYLLDKILSSLLYMYYSGYSKYDIAYKLSKMSFNDYQIINKISRIKYHSLKDLKEILLHIYTYDKMPIIILKSQSGNEANKAKFTALFAYYTYLVGDTTSLYGLVRGYIGDNYDISYNLSSAIKNASRFSSKDIYVLTDS